MFNKIIIKTKFRGSNKIKQILFFEIQTIFFCFDLFKKTF